MLFVLQLSEVFSPEGSLAHPNRNEGGQGETPLGCSPAWQLSLSSEQWAVGSRQGQAAPSSVIVPVLALGTQALALGHGQCYSSCPEV